MFLLTTRAYAVVQIPPLNTALIDEAAFIPQGSRSRVENTLRQLYQNGGPQMVVWTFLSLEGDDIAQVGIRAAEKWKIGRAEKDDGLILLVARQERMMRLEVGRGLEGVIPDIVSDRLLQRIIRPALVNNSLDEGVLKLVQTVSTLVSDPDAAKKMQEEANQNTSKPFPVWGIFGIIVVVMIIRWLDNMRGPPPGFGGRRRGGIFWGGGMGRGGRSGDGWSGGGGGFGGGGSSSKW